MADIYHVLSRGVDKRKIFLDDQDRIRFIHDLYEFNDEEPVSNVFYRFQKNIDIASRYIKQKPRKLLVKIHVFNLLPNHYHLMLSSLRQGVHSLFMKKLNIGYSKYFNEKYERTGALFEGRFRRVLIKNQSHFIHLPYYIHVINTLDLLQLGWREKKEINYTEAIKFLDSYRWSSHLDYCGKKNFPSVTQRDFLLEFFGGEENYQKEIRRWLKEFDVESMRDIILEE